MTVLPTREQADRWLARWDRQQRRYIPDREERFAVVIEVIETVVGRPDPLIVDLGCGPGSLAHRLLERVPDARVVGVDADPLLLGLGAIARPHERLRTVRVDLRADDWTERLALERAPDAFVSSTALHWMNREPLRRLLAACAAALAPGGVFVNADHLYENAARSSRLDELGRAMTARRVAALADRSAEEWQEWWDAAEAAPELAELARQRAGGFEHVVDDRASVHDHVDLLRAVGFAESGTVWQVGDDRIVVGLL